MRWPILLLSFLIWKPAEAQNFDFVGEQKVPGVRAIYADEIANFYLLTKSNVVEKYHVEKGFQKQFSLKSLGQIHSLDVTSPYKIVCFYKDVGTIVILDNQLSEITRINLFNLGYFNIEAVCRARDNALWVFDKSDVRIKKLSYDGQVLLSGPQLNLGKESMSVDGLMETSARLLLSDGSKLHLLSIQLGLEKTVDLKATSQLNIAGDLTHYVDSTSCKSYNLKTLLKNKLLLPSQTELKKVNRVLFVPNYLLVWSGNSLKKYRRS